MEQDQPKETRYGFYGRETIGINAVHLEDLVNIGLATKEVLEDGNVVYTTQDGAKWRSKAE